MAKALEKQKKDLVDMVLYQLAVGHQEADQVMERHLRVHQVTDDREAVFQSAAEAQKKEDLAADSDLDLDSAAEVQGKEKGKEHQADMDLNLSAADHQEVLLVVDRHLLGDQVMDARDRAAVSQSESGLKEQGKHQEPADWDRDWDVWPGDSPAVGQEEEDLAPESDLD